MEELPWSRGKEHSTLAFQTFLSQWARQVSWTDAAARFKTSWDTVCAAVRRVVDYGLEHRDLEGVELLGVDEITIGKGHNYVSMVYQIDTEKKLLLWIGKDRKAKTILWFFMDFGKQRSAAIRHVCSAMWKPYLKVIAKKIPQALNILDRFHIMG